MAENTKRDSNKPQKPGSEKTVGKADRTRPGAQPDKTKGSSGSPPDRGQPAPGRMPPEKTSVNDDLDLDLDDEDDRAGQRSSKADPDDGV